MSQNEFASQLTKLGSPANISAAELSANALRHNRRRIRFLAALTIGLWVITFLLVPGLWMPFAAKMKSFTFELSGRFANQGVPITTDKLSGILQEALRYIAAVSGMILAIMILAALLAAVSTVWLVLTVRRVTLEQLSMGLTQIADELRRLRTPPA